MAKAIVHAFHTEIFPTGEEVQRLCRPGSADTCIWLVVGAQGFECMEKNKPHTLLDRWMKGQTVAKRDGCDVIKDWNPTAMGEVEIKTE